MGHKRTINGIRYTVKSAERDGWYDYGKQARADVALLLDRLDSQAAALSIVENYLDWEYALHGMHETVDLHKQLVDEGREKPTVVEAREAMKRLRESTS